MWCRVAAGTTGLNIRWALMIAIDAQVGRTGADGSAMAAPQFFRRNGRIASVLMLIFLVVFGLFTPSTASAAGTYVGSAILPGNNGYWLTTSNGAVTGSGDAKFYGDMRTTALNQPVIAMAATASGRGYWLLAADGGIFSFGDAAFYGSTGDMRLNQPVVGMASTPSGRGYWLVARDGGIFTFGDAAFYGSTGSIRLNQPIVGASSTADGRGYWLVAADGGIFAFGNAAFYGSTGSIRLNSPIVGMSTTPSGRGYWLAGADGGIFTFGDASFRGSSAGAARTQAIAVLRDATGGYTLVRSDGSVDSRPGPSTPALTPIETDLSVDTAPVTTALGWQLREQEDFNGTSLNNRWPVYNGAGTAGVGVRRPSAVSVGNGQLQITGRGWTTGGTCWCYPGGDQVYGKWEIRAKMDNGRGYWPALLLWPQSERWPIDGEIDIAEFNSPVRNASSFTVHYGSDNKQIQYTSPGDFTQWHIFGVDWQPNYIKYYLDGKLMYTITKPEAIPHTPMHLALQVDASDGSTGVPSADASTSSTLSVDWVRVYHP